MPYIALYRKWRPRKFADLVGQEHVSRTLSQAITTGRLGHAFLFSGPRGTGKTSTAKILAMSLNCEHGPTLEPCGTCASCQGIALGTDADVREIDAASNRGVDEIREMRESVHLAPTEGRYKIYIIDEVHMLTTEAFNALLKTLEEPPEHVVFILATTEANKVPPTIQSRCQRFDFRRITVGEIQGRLRYICDQMKTPADDKALELIALQADGGLRDALSILDQCISLSDGTVTEQLVQDMLGLVGHSWIYRMTEALAARKSQDVLNLLAELLQDGKDLRQIVSELELHLRSLMIYQAAGTVEGLDLYAEPEDVLQQQSALWPAEAYMQMLARLHETMQELRWSPQPRITVEIALLALARGDYGQMENLDAQMAAAKATAAANTSATTGTVDDARLAQLEARIADLAKQLASRPAMTAAPAATKAAPRTTTSSTSSAAPTGTATAGATPVAPPAPAVDNDTLATWQQALAAIREQGGERIAVCFEPATLLRLEGGVCELQYPSDHLALAGLVDRIYRKKSEAILTEFFGRDMKILCQIDRAHPAAKVKPPRPAKQKPAPPMPHEDKPMAVDKSAMTPDAQANFEHSMDIIEKLGGGTVVEPPKPPEYATSVPPLNDSDAPPEEEET